MRLALYALLVGGALGASIYVWHVWSDNAYLSPYLLGVFLLLAGVVAAMVAAARRWGIVRAFAATIVAAAIALVLVGPLGIARPLAELAVAGGNGSQSPCALEFQRQNAAEIARHEEEMKRREAELGIKPPTPEQIRAADISGLTGSMPQFIVPFLTGMLTLAPALRRAPRRELAQALVVAGVVVAYIYVRGAGAWCGQLFGLDSLAVIIAGAVVAARSPR